VGIMGLVRHPVTVRGMGGRTIPRWGFVFSVVALALGVTLVVTHGSAFGFSVGVALVVISVAVFILLLSRGRCR
jgi:hypothetical protein